MAGTRKKRQVARSPEDLAAKRDLILDATMRLLTDRGYTKTTMTGVAKEAGIGIDNGVHVIHRYRLEGEGQIGTVLNTVGRSIMLTSLTTIAAFGTFAFGLYRGLSTMGIILGIGIAICFLMSAFLLPALLRIPWYDDDVRRTILSAQANQEEADLWGSEEELDDLLDVVAGEANHERLRTWRARLDGVFDKLEATLKGAPRGSAP